MYTWPLGIVIFSRLFTQVLNARDISSLHSEDRVCEVDAFFPSLFMIGVMTRASQCYERKIVRHVYASLESK